MTRETLLCVLLLSIALPSGAGESETWAFTPDRDRFSNQALLDLSNLNEDVAGESGFVRLSPDGESFVRGDGVPIRFWAVNTSVWKQGLPALREHAKFLAKRGVNMVRFHGQIPQAGREGGSLEAISEEQRDQLWQLVAAMKEEGIYTTFSPYYPHAVKPEAARRWIAPRDSEGMTGLVFFDPLVQRAYKSWLREILTRKNPYTGLALKDDPALAIVQMQNEDSLLFWTLNRIRGREAHLLGQEFAKFLVEKYGSLDRARSAWNGAEAPDALDNVKDDWVAGIVALSKIWHLTAKARNGDAEVRLRDQTQFLTQMMLAWNGEVARFLREDLQAPQLFNAGNWKTADSVVLDDLERYSYTAGDIVGVNRYVTAMHEGSRRGWAIVVGDRFHEEGLLRRPLDLPLTLRQPSGAPYIVTETLWVPPMWQQVEGPILMAAYQSLLGIDASYWYTAREVQWREPQSANGFLPSIGKWVLGTPTHLGMFPAAALLYRRGYVEPVEPVVIEHRSLASMWSREAPLVVSKQGYDPNRDNRLLSIFDRGRSQISPYSFLAGPIMVVFGSSKDDFIREDIARFVDEASQVVTSTNRQLVWDWGRGVVTIDSERAQGVVGTLSARQDHTLGDIDISSDNNYGSILVVSLDDRPIATSRKLLVQMGTLARPTGWRAKPVEQDGASALEVSAFGRTPWQVDRLDAVLTIRNPFLVRAISLDPNGMSVDDLATSLNDGSLQLKLPADKLYVIIEAGERG